MSLILKNSVLRLGCSNLLRVLPTRYARFSSTLSFKRNDSDFKISKLSNGIRVATMKFGIDSIPNSLTFGLWVDSGSRNEVPGKNGAAHFLEHLIFKGTYNRSRKEIESEIEDLGAHLNAYTTREQTVYQIRCFNQDLPKCMNLLSDIIKNSKFCKSAIEQEKGVVLREMEEVNKSEEELIFDDLHREMFKNHPLGNTILGPKENILGFKREDLINYMLTNYIPEKMMILGVGNIDHSYFKNIAENYFGNESSHSRNSLSLKNQKKKSCLFNFQDINEMNFINKPVLVHKKTSVDGKSLLAMAYNGTSWKSKDFLKVMFLQSMLGEYGTNNINRVTGYKNQIIERILSGIKDHVEFFETFNTCYKDTGKLCLALSFYF
ncbi:mitochondrial processing peptidase beta subunit [Cryptosporidium sp. chipmunk genotype I]|uniref:mitochondrial processing peptidase beta subunit n=1 Tax=Cryptosporidium sp. chipmunk genotype I TaxID=1280935 RepID=UPI00351A557D|nr:mitochondrial processing peptidase beta subunit [Cryptosporidium sp. chipmunk genotype I]